jgi:hypothetical protein
MSINNIAGSFNIPQSYPPVAPVPANEAVHNASPVQATEADTPAAVYATSSTAPAAGNYRTDFDRMREIWNTHNQQVDSFRRMIETLLNRQSQEWTIGQGQIPPNGFTMFEVTDEMRAEAQSQIEEGGYFSVESTASRILDFAVAISGGDPARIDVLRGAIEQAFTNAERQWGGELPEISSATRDAIMQGLDQWQQAGSASAITLLNQA